MKNRIFVIFSFFVSLFCFAVSYAAVAAPPLITEAKVVKGKNGLEFEIGFTGSYSAKNLKPIYERDFVQFVLTGVGVKSARMIPVDSGLLEKVFIYQYQPGTARIRFIMKNKAEAPKGMINLWNAKNNTIRFQLKRQILERLTEKKQESVVSTTPEEEILLKDVVKDEVTAAAKDSSALTGTAAIATAVSEPVGIKADPSRNFARMIISLLVVIGIFVGGLFLLRKYADRIDLKKLPFSKKERLIQVVASHRLGKSQAISLVKVTNEYMVMGISGDNITLITKLGRDVDVEKYLDDRHWGGVLEKHIKDLEKPQEPKFTYDGAKDMATNANHVAAGSPVVSSFRSSIKNKITHLKSLS